MHLKKTALLGVATLAAAAGAAVIPATVALAATPSLTVTMNEPAGYNEQSGDTVTAVGTGYTAGATIALVQCSSLAPDGSGCDQTPANARITTADASGGFTVSDLVVTTGAKGNGTCGAGAQCFVAGANIANTAEQSANAFQFDRLQVTPRTGLKTGQSVNVSGGGFTPNATVYVSECTSNDPAKATTSCDFNSIKTYTTDANGAFATAPYPVHTGTVGSDGVKCNAGGSCILAATDNVLNPANGKIGGTVIQFAAITATKTVAKSTKTTVAAGKAFAIKGTLTAAAAGLNGAKVSLFKTVGSKTSKVATKTTATLGSTKGAFKFSVTQKKTTKYQVKFAGGTIGSKTYGPSASKVLKVST